MDRWMDTCNPSIDPDSTHPAHQGAFSIAPFQTHSRYFYARIGEDCCGRHFVELYYQQHHPFPHCNDCARMILGNASLICWQCRTYFHWYGTGLMQQIMGVTPQRHNYSAVMGPDRRPDQHRLPEEERAQAWRDATIRLHTPPILQVLLPQENTCQFWHNVSESLDQFQNHRCLFSLPTVPLPYYSEEALLPLSPTPEAGVRTGLSLYPEVVDDIFPGMDIDTDPTVVPD